MAMETPEETTAPLEASAPESAVEDTGSDNMSMAAYTDALKASGEPETEAETGEAEGGDAEPAGDAEPEAQEEVMQEEEPEQPEPEAAPDVLSKYGIDLDTLEPEEASELKKALNVKALKRFGTLTARNKELEEANVALHTQVASAAEQAQPTTEPVPAFLKDTQLGDIHTEVRLAQEVENLNGLVEWAEESMDNEVQYDDAGNEFVAEDNGKHYSKADLRRIRANARKMLRKDVPARRQWLAERMASDNQSLETFEFLADEDSEEYQFFVQAKNSPFYKPLLDHLPNGNFALGLLVEGLKAVKKRQEGNGTSVKTPAKPKAPAAVTEAAPAKSTGPQGESRQKKAVQAARGRFEKSGSMADYQHYLRLSRGAA